MHGATFAAAIAADTAKQLAQHRIRVRAFRQRMAMPAMGGQQNVIPAQIPHHAHRHRLLPDGGVDGAEHDLLIKAAQRRFLQRADAPHHPMLVAQAG